MKTKSSFNERMELKTMCIREEIEIQRVPA